MEDNFFKLNDPFDKINSQIKLEDELSKRQHLESIAYMPNELNKLKISNKIFTNFSFSKTAITEVYFHNCKFINCLFIASKLINCEFHNCEFKDVNTHKITIESTYIDPEDFVHNFKEYNKANIATHLFLQLLNNSKDSTQGKFSRIAKYNFLKWQNRTIFLKFSKSQPHSISGKEFLKKYPANLLFDLFFGYGLKLRNFLITFSIVFACFLGINHTYWNDFAIKSTSAQINSFNTDSVNASSNFYYTLENTTKLLSTSYRPTTDFGLIWLTIESLVGFLFLSALVTLIINRFVK